MDKRYSFEGDPRYSFRGEYFVDLLDGLSAANRLLSEEVETYPGPRLDTLERYLENVFKYRNEMDGFFSEERLMVNGGSGENYFELEWDVGSYERMVNVINNGEVPQEDKTEIPYLEAPSPYAVIAFQEELVDEWRTTEQSYQDVARIENRLNRDPESEGSLLWRLSEKGYEAPEYIGMMALGLQDQ